MPTTTRDTDLGEADRALKARHRMMWASGDYPAVAREIVGDLGPDLVAFAGVSRGATVLDVAAGSGSASIAAALLGADVTASDLTPELFDAGRLAAEAEGVDLEWSTADAEALPFDDGAFDIVLSCIGVMFAPHHETAAAELSRVAKPGGTIALTSWTPAGFIGQMFATMKPFAPPPPPGAQPAPLWGDEAHLADLLGHDVEDLRMEKRTLPVTRFTTPEAFRDYFKTNYGPTIAVYRFLADRPTDAAALDTALTDLARRFDRGGGAMEWEYLIARGTRRG
ncbi:MAG: hypothetical protein RI885_936 [Actinomycetota bacterium]